MKMVESRQAPVHADRAKRDGIKAGMSITVLRRDRVGVAKCPNGRAEKCRGRVKELVPKRQGELCHVSACIGFVQDQQTSDRWTRWFLSFPGILKPSGLALDAS